MAWATNAAPRSTTKKPTTPAITATSVAAIQVLTMKPENTVCPLYAASPGCSAHPLAVRRGARSDRRLLLACVIPVTAPAAR